MQLDKDGDYKTVYLTTTEIFQEGQWREVGSPKRIIYHYTGIVRIKIIIIIIIIKVGPLPVGLRAIRGATLDNSVFMTGQIAYMYGQPCSEIIDIAFDKLELIKDLTFDCKP